eukprot:scaffold2342_cov368-Pinguiococcus_pyrenoidosus.AAC.10
MRTHPNDIQEHARKVCLPLVHLARSASPAQAPDPSKSANHVRRPRASSVTRMAMFVAVLREIASQLQLQNSLCDLRVDVQHSLGFLEPKLGLLHATAAASKGAGAKGLGGPGPSTQPRSRSPTASHCAQTMPERRIPPEPLSPTGPGRPDRNAQNPRQAEPRRSRWPSRHPRRAPRLVKVCRDRGGEGRAHHQGRSHHVLGHVVARRRMSCAGCLDAVVFAIDPNVDVRRHLLCSRRCDPVDLAAGMLVAAAHAAPRRRIVTCIGTLGPPDVHGL